MDANFYLLQDSFSWPGGGGDLAIGHALVLMQMDWPQESLVLNALTKQILGRKTFGYPLFQAYVINVDILEELTYLWTEQGGGIHLDIAVNTGILQSRYPLKEPIDRLTLTNVFLLLRRS